MRRAWRSGDARCRPRRADAPLRERPGAQPHRADSAGSSCRRSSTGTTRDFGGSDDALRAYVARVADEPARSYQQQRPELDFLDYDWTLNAQPGQRPDNAVRGVGRALVRHGPRARLTSPPWHGRSSTTRPPSPASPTRSSASSTRSRGTRRATGSRRTRTNTATAGSSRCALLWDVRAKLVKTYGDAGARSAKVFRIHRDVRFSRDKAPYKQDEHRRLPADRRTRQQRRAGPVALYVQLGTGNYVGAGSWIMEPRSSPRTARRCSITPRRRADEAAREARQGRLQRWARTTH